MSESGESLKSITAAANKALRLARPPNSSA
jgi:hypothetical protein